MSNPQKLALLNARLVALHIDHPVRFVLLGAAIGTAVGLALCPVIDWLSKVGIR